MQKTKIIATLGPACNKRATIRQMLKDGLDVIRINMSHSPDFLKLKKQICMIRKEAKQLNQNISIMMDLGGPKIRVKLPGLAMPAQIIKGQQYSLGYKDCDININKKLNFQNIQKNACIKIDDGSITFSIKTIKTNHLILQARNDGLITHNKGVNFPGISLQMPAVTSVDKKHIIHAIDLEVDWIAQSFVRTAANILPIQRILNKYNIQIPIIAKIEKPEALDNLDSIIQTYAGILIARGDLGVEMNLSALPKLQKQIINHCIYHKKPCIVATQMLESMIINNTPTRAEVNDVANAIYDGVDAVMLSAETAAGQYPTEAVYMMSQIAQSIESDFDISNFNRNIIDSLSQSIDDNYLAICHAAYSISTTLDIRVIVVLTDSGKTAIQMAQFRPHARIVAITPFKKVCNQLSMIWGIIPVHQKQPSNINQLYHSVNKTLINRNLINTDNNFLLATGILKNIKNSTNMLQIYQAK
tara:strand:- start:17 stop:1432 length:1416 start_codon:yes stop_codon:yes gene_type:complete